MEDTHMDTLRYISDCKDYGSVVREERFFCAVLFHSLLTKRVFLEWFWPLEFHEIGGQ